MRRTLGTAVFAGMLGVTLFGLFLTPAFSAVIQVVHRRGSGRPGAQPEAAAVGPLPEGHEETPNHGERHDGDGGFTDRPG